MVFHEPHLQAVHAKLKTNEARRLKMQPRNMQALIKMALQFGIEKIINEINCVLSRMKLPWWWHFAWVWALRWQRVCAVLHKITLNTLLLGRNNVGNTMHIEYTSNREANFWLDWTNAWNVGMLIYFDQVSTMVRRIKSLVTFTPLWNPSPNQDELICRPPPQLSGLICLLSLQRCSQRLLKLVITLVYGITMLIFKGNDAFL